MHSKSSLWSFLILFCSAAALATQEPLLTEKFPCTGGSIYFIAHPVDSLLFQNPDLLHDLYVFKCITTVVFTSGNRGVLGNFSLELERGLEKAYSWMIGLPTKEPTPRYTSVQIDKHKVLSWSLRDMPNIQILYFRLPDSAPSGQGYETNAGESLMKLYNEDINSITTVDGNATYTLEDLKDLIGAILHERQANNFRLLNHRAPIFHPQDIYSDHADHIISAKLVMDVIEKEKIAVSVKAYAGDFMRKLVANVDESHPDFERKVTAFFQYAEHDEQMCQNLEECHDVLKDDEADLFLDRDVKYVAQYLEREYYIS